MKFPSILCLLGSCSALGFSTEPLNSVLVLRSLRGLPTVASLIKIRRGLDLLNERGVTRLSLQKRVKSESPEPEGRADKPRDKYVNNVLTNPVQGLPKSEQLQPVNERIAIARKTPLTGQTQDTHNPKDIQDWNTETGKNTVQAVQSGSHLEQPHNVLNKETIDSKKRTDPGGPFDNPETKKMRQNKPAIQQGRPQDDQKTFTDEKGYFSREKKPGEPTVTNEVSAKEQRQIEAGPVRQTNQAAREQGKPAEQRIKNIPQEVKDSKPWRENMPARLENTPERQRTPESPVSQGKTPPPINTGLSSSPGSSRQASPEPPSKRQRLNSGEKSPTGSPPPPGPKLPTAAGGVGSKRKTPSKRDLAALVRRRLRAKLHRRVAESSAVV